MPTASLPRSAEFLVASDLPTLAQIRSFRRLAEQDVEEHQRLSDLLKDGLGTVKKDKNLREGILAYALALYADAEELLEDGKEPLAQAVMGMIYADLDESQDAIKELKAAAKNLPEAFGELARVQIAAGDLDAARTAVEQLPEGAEREYLEGSIAEADNQIELAINCFEASLEADNTYVEAAFKLGVLLDRIGDDDMAIEYFLVCADNYPHYLPGVINLGNLYEERGEANAAIDCFRQVLAYNRENQRARMLLRDAQASRSMFYDEREEREKERMQKILRTPVNDFELSVRSRNCLAKMNIFTLGDLISITETEMLNYKNFGETSLKEVREMLSQRNLRLGMLRENDDRGLTKSDQKMLAESTDRLELSEQAMKVVQSLGFTRIGDLHNFADLDLYRVPGSGQTVVQELFTALGAYGLSLSRPDIV
jgi:DNA-directed RNA polymerase subunit alpha